MSNPRPTGRSERHPGPSGARHLWHATAISVVVALIGGMAVRALTPVEVLAAAQRVQSFQDADGDGLTDVLELVHGTDPQLADTDGDGFDDAVELALGTDPNDPNSVPEDPGLSVALVAYEDKNVFHLTQLLYAPEGKTAGLGYGLFLYVNGVATQLPPEVYLANSSLRVIAAGPGGDTVLLLTTSVPSQLIHQLGSFSFIAAAASEGSAKPVAAAGITLLTLDGVVHEVQTAVQAGQGQLGPGSVYKPLKPAEQLPGSFTPNQICYQTASAVAVSGPMVIFEVDASDCVAADAYCAGSACTGQVGTTYELLDPLILIGG